MSAFPNLSLAVHRRLIISNSEHIVINYMVKNIVFNNVKKINFYDSSDIFDCIFINTKVIIDYRILAGSYFQGCIFSKCKLHFWLPRIYSERYKKDVDRKSKYKFCNKYDLWLYDTEVTFENHRSLETGFEGA